MTTIASIIKRFDWDDLDSSPGYIEWKARDEEGMACNYQAEWVGGSRPKLGFCNDTPVLRWQDVSSGHLVPSAYCAGCAREDGPPGWWTDPVTLTILPGCPDDVREWAEARERLIDARLDGTRGTDWRRDLIRAVEAWVDGPFSMPGDVPYAVRVPLADAVCERRRLTASVSDTETTITGHGTDPAST